MAASNSLRASDWRDPAIVVEEKELFELGCRACTKHTHLFERVICTDARKQDNKNVPRIGSKCKFFELKD
jgi:hypothetical protein